ncbi:MAG: hypothetical protein C0467_08960 [Planctomycetaceae bacterium]|nr:hypothetical protein [Planctomycetaceae bacterium]
MTIECPYCNAILTPKALKPGNYTPKCPKCSQPFALMVPEDDDEPITVEQIDPKPLPKTTPVPMLKRSDLPPESDDEDEENDEDESDDTKDGDDSENIADDEEPAEKPLPKTQRYPMVRRTKPPEPAEDDDE